MNFPAGYDNLLLQARTFDDPHPRKITRLSERLYESAPPLRASKFPSYGTPSALLWAYPSGRPAQICRAERSPFLPRYHRCSSRWQRPAALYPLRSQPFHRAAQILYRTGHIRKHTPVSPLSGQNIGTRHKFLLRILHCSHRHHDRQMSRMLDNLNIGLPMYRSAFQTVPPFPSEHPQEHSLPPPRRLA